VEAEWAVWRYLDLLVSTLMSYRQPDVEAAGASWRVARISYADVKQLWRLGWSPVQLSACLVCAQMMCSSRVPRLALHMSANLRRAAPRMFRQST
jgi:hypothetical protein